MAVSHLGNAKNATKLSMPPQATMKRTGLPPRYPTKRKSVEKAMWLRKIRRSLQECRDEFLSHKEELAQTKLKRNTSADQVRVEEVSIDIERKQTSLMSSALAVQGINF